MENKDKDQQQSHRAAEELQQSGGLNNASGNFGGTTDMDDEAINVGRTNVTERGSGVTTKRNVSGSDFDGQVAP